MSARTHSAGPSEVERIIRASMVTRPLSQYSEMERIRVSSMRHNERGGIHAALLYQSGWYVHWAEGPGDMLRELLARVDKDPRHHSHHLLHHSRGERYLPTAWSMMLNPSTETFADFGLRVGQLFQARQRGTQFPPTSVMRRLAAPLRVRGPETADAPESFHRVGVCSADEGRSFELVRWLATRRDASGQTRRVAGEHDLDSGSDYAEFLQDGWPCRVIAVSRAGLQHGLRRAFLPDWPFLLLLFGDDAKRNAALLERVREAFMGLPVVPHLLGVAMDPAVHARISVASRMAGLSYTQLGLFDIRDSAAVWSAVAERLREIGPPRSSQWDMTQPNWVS
ncbi:BLUF domain-containing protein [Caenimonas sedimenti]|nr:BLUF domain-containing protein [Caenimonas sedimenti]